MSVHTRTHETVSDEQSIDDLHKLDAKALTTVMTVLPDGPGVDGAEDMWIVQHEHKYVVARVGDRYSCECKGYQFGHKCYHIRRLEFELGDRDLPAWLNDEALDDNFRAFIDSDGESDGDDDGDCDCAGLSDDLPCFECFRADEDVSVEVSTE